MALAQQVGGAPGAVGQDVPDPLPRGEHLGQAHHGGRIAEWSREADLRLGQHAVREAVHDPGDRRPGSDRVEPVLVADLVGQRDRMEVVHAAVGTEDGRRLVFRAAVALLHRPALPLRLDGALAAHRARIAGLPRREDRRGHRLAGDRLVAIELAGVVVEGRQAAGGVLALQHALGPVRAQAEDVGVIGDLGGAPPGELAQGLDVGHRHLPVRAAHHDRLEVLGAHDGAHAGSAIRPVAHADDRGQADALLAGRSDRRHLDLRVVELLFEQIGGRGRGLAPQVARRPQLGLAIVDPQVDGLG